MQRNIARRLESSTLPWPSRGRIEFMSTSASRLPVAAVVLAAGEGRRFAQRSNRFKLLEPAVNGSSLVRTVCQTALQAVDEVVVVGHHHHEAVARALSGLALRHIHCARAPAGLGASIKCGLAQVPATHAVMILLADMPFVRVHTLLQVRQALQAGAGIVRPVFEGRPGHPVGFSLRFRAALLSLDDAHGAAQFIRGNAAFLTCIPVRDAGCIRDVDVPEDLAQES